MGRPVKEVWKDIKDFEGYYQISNLGRVKSVSRIVEGVRLGKPWFKTVQERTLKQKVNKYGYFVVGLSIGNKTKTFTVHRLVAQSFCEKPENYEVVNHIDGNKENNKYDNLEWCTPKMNSDHAHSIGLVGIRPKEISEKDIDIIVGYYEKGYTAPEIAKLYKYHSGTISKIIKENYTRYNTRQHVRNDLKLSWEKVNNIREEYKKGMSGVELSKKYNISRANVSLIINNKTWIKYD
ncbi:NUMOD4 domain-containing protein [bacterium]|nr:NUMOD4 domain-containing protein [bacterium]